MQTERAEFKRAWPVLVTAALGAATGAAPLLSYSLGALIDPLSHAFGWTRGEITTVTTVRGIAGLFVGTIVGYFADRFGARRVALISQVLLVISVASMALVTQSIWTLYAAYFVATVLGAGTLPITWSRAITGWFLKGRGLALGLAMIGTGLVGAALLSYLTWLIGLGGWRLAYLGLAAVPLVVSLPLTFLLFREAPVTSQAPTSTAATTAVPNDDVTAEEDGFTLREAMKTGCFWVMVAAFAGVAAAAVAIQVNALPLLTDRGIERPVAAGLVGLFGIGLTAGRLISGYFLDIFRGPVVAVVLFIVPAFACVLLAMSGSNLVVAGACIAVIGLSAGAEHDTAAYFTAKYFGRRHYGAIYGLLYTLIAFGGSVGPPIVAALSDATHSYKTSLYGIAVVFLLAAICAAVIRKPAARVKG